MKQIWIPRPGPPSILELREAPDPEPGPSQVRIRVEAAGVCFADLMARLGLYRDGPPLPAVVGYEVAGKIDAVGAEVPKARLQEAVVAPVRFGGYSTHVIVESSHALARPPSLDARNAASLPVNGLTAWMILEEMARVRRGDRVLVHSAGGGLGLLALDLLKWRGAQAVGTASRAKHALLKERGYDELVDYTAVDFEETLSGGPGFDLVLDPVGGASWSKSFRLLRPGGKLVCFGISTSVLGEKRQTLRSLLHVAKTPWSIFTPLVLLNANKGIMGVNMGRLWNARDRLEPWMRSLLDLAATGVIRPLVHAAVPFSKAHVAHEIIHRRENVGKVVLVPDEFA